MKLITILDVNLDQIKQQVRDLRDADFHVCPAQGDDTQECTCEKFDFVIDQIDKLKYMEYERSEERL